MKIISQNKVATGTLARSIYPSDSLTTQVLPKSGSPQMGLNADRIHEQKLPSYIEVVFKI